MPERTEFSFLRSTEELHAIAPEWSGLWSNDPQSTPFQSPEWLLPWWHQFGQPDLRAVAICEDGRLVGLLPFYIYLEPRSGERQLLLLGVGTSDYLGGIFAPSCTTAHIQQALALLEDASDWDTLYATQLRPDSLLFQAIDRSPDTRASRFHTDNCSWLSAMSIPELPQKLRRNVMYYRNRAQRQGDLTFEVATSADLLDTFAAFERMHTSSWQQRGQSGVLADPRVLAWHREALPLLERAGILRFCSLRLDGEIIASLYSLVDPPTRSARTQYIYLPAYSPDHADLRPGTLLMAYALEHAATNGIATVDLLRGDEPYKQIWHAEQFPTFGFSQLHPAYREISADEPAQQAA